MMDWNTLLSTARMERTHVWIPQQQEDERSQWQRDHDRLIFSGAFRRLAVKTQVHSLSDNDHVHTRLSHSLEVASVGRSLGVRLGRWMQEQGLLSDQHSDLGIGALVQAACLAHDIGNPPFGHAGERAIRQFFESSPEYLDGLTPAERSDLLGFRGKRTGISGDYSPRAALVRWGNAFDSCYAWYLLKIPIYCRFCVWSDQVQTRS